MVRHVSACLANADLPVEERARSRRRSRRAAGAPSSEVVNDTFALLRAGLDEPRGVAVVCGAGHQLRRRAAATARTARFAAVGHISGDWGGGGHLWQEAMWWAARAEDGRGPDTALRERAARRTSASPSMAGADRGRAPRRASRRRGAWS